jgi:hypothetical protein
MHDAVEYKKQSDNNLKAMENRIKRMKYEEEKA